MVEYLKHAQIMAAVFEFGNANKRNSSEQLAGANKKKGVRSTLPEGFPMLLTS